MLFLKNTLEIISSFYKTLYKTTPYIITTCTSGVGLLGLLGWLVFSSPNYTLDEKPPYSGPCPPISGINYTNHIPNEAGATVNTQQLAVISSKVVNCAKIIQGDKGELNFTQPYSWCQRQTQITELDYIKEAENCDSFKSKFNYNSHRIDDEERNFPIAFSILTYENIEQTERLLRAIYRPQNVYCVHVDGKASSVLLEALVKIGKCFDNVIVPEHPVIVHWAEFTVLQAELLCLRRLWDTKTKWKYFINLTGREFPIRTNKELVKILKAYNGANDIDGNRYNRNRDWTDYVWRAENWRTNTHKSPVPHDYNIHKGSAHIVASRDFIDYVLNNPDANDFIEWLRDTRLPDEHFFNTLNHNPQFKVPGSYKGDPGLKPFYGRLKLWWENKDSVCSGEWSRYICNLGPGELQQVVNAKHLFVNKLVLEMSPIAYQCLEQWYWNRTKLEQVKGKIPKDVFDLKFYKSLKIVTDHI